MKKTSKQFINEAKLVHSNRYNYSKVNYVGSHEKIEIICLIHGSFWQKAYCHISGQGCPKCLKITTKQFIINAIKVHDNKYDYSKTNYINAKIKLEIICKKHGSFWQRSCDFLKGKGCPSCSNDKKRKTIKQFIIEAVEVHDNKYDYSKVNYVNAKTKIEIICKKHGSFWQIPISHLQMVGCPICKTSKGEKQIRQYLIKNKFLFLQQKTFSNCKNKNLLPFDFYLPDQNMCVEYDGIQHFKPIKYFGGEEGFNQTQIKDKIKDQYCLNNNIDLLRIAYNENINIKLKLNLTKKE